MLNLECTSVSEKLHGNTSNSEGGNDVSEINSEGTSEGTNTASIHSIQTSLQVPTLHSVTSKGVVQKEREGRSAATTEGIWKCSICGYNISIMNKELHLVHCQKRKQVESMRKKTTPSSRDTPPQRKKKSAKAESASIPDDLDSLLEQMRVQDKTCNFTSCKKSVNHLGITCPYCHKKYCMTHNMAEVHGCGETAKRIAKQEYLKSMEDRKQQHTTRTDPTKRAQLQRKLDKKINDMSSGRQRKKPPSS